MKQKIIAATPFIILPLFVPIYELLDKHIFVEVFGCGCVPHAQTNMLNIPFNANDLRLAVFFALTVCMSVWSFIYSKRFERKSAKVLYCICAILVNVALSVWVMNTFTWD